MNSHVSMKEDQTHFYPHAQRAYPYPSPCESEWSNNSEWLESPTSISPYGTGYPGVRSPESSPTGPYSHNGTYTYRSIEQPSPSHYRSNTFPPTTLACAPSPPARAASSEPDTSVPEPPKIKRSPNAFLLFRSDFLKNKTIPASAEKRQQNLSRVCGEVWNLASPDVKAKWQAKAAEALAAHQRAHPNYKFTPAARGTGKTKSKALRAEAAAAMREIDEKGMIRKLREQFVPGATGPAVAPARRRRKTRKVDKKFISEVATGPVYPRSRSPPLSPTSPTSPTYDGPAFNAPLLPPQSYSQMLYNSMPVPRRPSTSMGFTNAHRAGMGVRRPSSAGACEAELRPRAPFLAPALESSYRQDLGYGSSATSSYQNVQQPMSYSPSPPYSEPTYTNNVVYPTVAASFPVDVGSPFTEGYSFPVALSSHHNNNTDASLGLRELRIPYSEGLLTASSFDFQEPYPLSPFDLPLDPSFDASTLFNNVDASAFQTSSSTLDHWNVAPVFHQ